MINLYKEIDFTDEIMQNPKLANYIEKTCEEKGSELTEESKFNHKPILDKQFNNFVVINGLPKVPVPKLKILDKVITEKILKKMELHSIFVKAEYDIDQEK